MIAFTADMHAQPLQPSPSRFLSSEFQSSQQQQPVQDTDAPKLSPSVVVIIILITVVFFLSGLLHLLARCFIRYSQRGNNNSDANILQGQLQHLFNLHDSGVEQAFIDALPVFFYKSVRGLKDGADCAVCLCEFQGEDRLRLLPNCSHAFHLDCIDTWLLSHSTCPLCRRSLLPDTITTPGTDVQSLQLDVAGEEAFPHMHASDLSEVFTVDAGTASTLSPGEEGASSEEIQPIQPSQEIGPTCEKAEGKPFKLMSVKLGRFCPMDAELESVRGSNASGRRSYSMGSYEYVINPSNLQVMIAPTPVHRRWANCKPPTPGHKSALSDFTPECRIEDASIPLSEELFVSNACLCPRDVSPYRKHRRPPSDGMIERGNAANPVADERSNFREHSTTHGEKWLISDVECSKGDGGRMKRSSAQRAGHVSSFQVINPEAKLMRSAFSQANRPAIDTVVEVPSSPTGSLQSGGVESRRHSIARKTLHWLMGRERRFVYPAANASATA
ncbi:hypothetical protein O6H91_13G037000 [Diphasiastrum complanatum]|nr:hypothetical protein O6H91_13G037000 [Diphasiastrum complanatum]